MQIYEFIWPEDRIEHIAEHGITPEEFEEVCFSYSLFLRVKSQGIILFTMHWAKLMLVDICFVSSLGLKMVKVSSHSEADDAS